MVFKFKEDCLLVRGSLAWNLETHRKWYNYKKKKWSVSVKRGVHCFKVLLAWKQRKRNKKSFKNKYVKWDSLW